MDIETTPRKKALLEKRGIYTTEDLLNFLPRKYYDYTHVYNEVTPSMDGVTGCFVGRLDGLKKKATSNKCSAIIFKLFLKAGRNINVTIFAQAYLWNSLISKEKRMVAVCGTLSYHQTYGFSITDPKHVVDYAKINTVTGIETEYSHISGISQEYMVKLIDEALDNYTDTPIDKDLLQKYKMASLPGIKQAYQMLHHPTDMNISRAQQRIVIDRMLKSELEMVHKERQYCKGTTVTIKSTKITQSIISSLPYSLTTDQEKYFEQMKHNIREGKRISALIQGDVGCGKTLIAILMLFLMAENGFQGEIMAPTAILARQHYEEIKKYGDTYGIKVAYFDGKVTAAAKRKIAEKVASGEISIVVGTQALASKYLTYSRLGLVIIDEEHRFGVKQRNALLDESVHGVNTILMSATPIPRTLASSIHGNSMEIMDIHSMPACRKPVQTATCKTDNAIFRFMEKELAAGRQAYVVCPLIEKNEDAEVMKDVISVNETYDIYKEHFGSFYNIAMLNGKMSEKEINEIIQQFKEGKVHILISTTVVEVGVNVPNASVIVISNAERFGLAAMHQLRGRVGRGKYKSYCILKSSATENERLHTMETCADGFSIAEKDLQLRGAGDMIGIKQSGNTEFIEYILRYPNMYEVIKKLAVDIVDRE